MAPHQRLRRLAVQVCEGFPGQTQLDSNGHPTAERNEGQRHVMPRIDPKEVEKNADAILKKYDEERDKRLEFSNKVGGMKQYKRLTDLAKTDPKFAWMLSDPYIEEDGSQERWDRPTLFDEVRVAIIGGAGYGGLSAGARLRMAGLEANDIRIVDKAGDVAGTWYWNRYPGAMCDVEAPVYMPLCEEIGYTPTERYCKQPEMQRHSRLIATHFGLYENAAFGRNVTELRWDGPPRPGSSRPGSSRPTAGTSSARSSSW